MVTVRGPLVVDGHVLAAYLDDRHPDHDACRAIVDSRNGPYVVPWTSVGEAARILERGRPEDAMPELARALADGLAFGRSHDFVTVAPNLWDLLRIQELQHDYEWLGFVEAAVVAAAERMRSQTLATSDRRYERVRPGHVDTLRLVRPDR